jgi:hypothetical protein
LDSNHLFMLLSLSLETFSFTIVLLSLGHLLIADSLLLVQTVLLISLLQLVFFLFSLLGKGQLLILGFSVTLSHINNVVSFLLGLLNFFPCLI